MSKSKRTVLAACICTCLSFLLFWNISSVDIALPGVIPKAVLPSCKHLAEDHETLFILRTGATEIADRSSAHISISLHCTTHVIFSDHAETFLGERVLDALGLVDPDIVAHNHEFELYRRVRQYGRAILSQSELSGNRSQVPPSDTGNEQIPAWKLDKWKFVPMVNRTLYEYPDMKWYVFAEGDTSILWSTLHPYLASLNHTEPLYLGSATNIGDDPAFAYGGAGFIVSRPAMRMIADYYSTHKATVETLTQASWAGDAVLGKVFFDAGVPVKDIWPVLHGASTSQALFARPWSPGVPKEAEQVWCYPAASLHHMDSAAVDSLWHYEQQWLEQRVDVSWSKLEILLHSSVLLLTPSSQNKQLIRHKDIFMDHVMPQMTGVRTDWDNLSDNDEGNANATSVDECRAVCERNSTCRQYSYDQSSGRCRTRVNPRLGIATKGVISGWLEDRIAAFANEMPACEEEGFDNLPGQW
jgi:hypothetical protein